MSFTPFVNKAGEPEIHGFLHEPVEANGKTVVLTHGAGSNARAPLLVEISEALAQLGFHVLRFDLPFRRQRPFGPPLRGSDARDRDGLRRAVAVMRNRNSGPTYMGGHSYGGRQATILASEDPGLIDGLLLLSYPLHPPRNPEQLRTAHFPQLAVPAFFAHGTRDPFGSIAEMQDALRSIPSAHRLFEAEGAGHDLLPRKQGSSVPATIAAQFLPFISAQ